MTDAESRLIERWKADKLPVTMYMPLHKVKKKDRERIGSATGKEFETVVTSVIRSYVGEVWYSTQTDFEFEFSGRGLAYRIGPYPL